MKKTILALSIGLLSACSQIPENAIVLSVGDDTAVFEENSQAYLSPSKNSKKAVIALPLLTAIKAVAVALP